ncbi:acyl-CoA thioesterase [Novosphingobium sp. B 225]|uniref:acyl-CoA thioesterase n=1 Tax=Novosphingobium sp. B 225 TaxID=1961849 RepID=UPI000B4B8658|nr:thioesterase family protein [Novosphingobium sp. B 225]
MAKPDPALLSAGRYPFVHEISTRFADMDPNNHLNNVALAAMFEDGRVRFNHGSGFREGMVGHRAMVASTEIAYLAEGHFPLPITVHCGVEALGRSSWTVVQMLIQQGKPIAFARSTLVCIRDDRPAPLPDAFRATLEQWVLRA